MATVNGVVGTQTISSKSVIDGRHPAVVRLMEFLADNGTIPAGEIIALNTEGTAQSYDPAGSSPLNIPVGVCTEDTDTSKDTAGNVMVHGAVLGSSLLVLGSEASASARAALEANTPVWIF